MPTNTTITFHEYNDETVNATIYNNVAATEPLDLTGTTVEFIYKLSSSQSDAEADTISGTVTDPTNGKCTFEIGNELVTLTKKFYRIDVISATLRKTAIYGTINVIDL